MFRLFSFVHARGLRAVNRVLCVSTALGLSVAPLSTALQVSLSNQAYAQSAIVCANVSINAASADAIATFAGTEQYAFVQGDTVNINSNGPDAARVRIFFNGNVISDETISGGNASDTFTFTAPETGQFIIEITNNNTGQTVSVSITCTPVGGNVDGGNTGITGGISGAEAEIKIDSTFSVTNPETVDGDVFSVFGVDLFTAVEETRDELREAEAPPAGSLPNAPQAPTGGGVAVVLDPPQQAERTPPQANTRIRNGIVPRTDENGQIIDEKREALRQACEKCEKELAELTQQFLRLSAKNVLLGDELSDADDDISEAQELQKQRLFELAIKQDLASSLLSPDSFNTFAESLARFGVTKQQIQEASKNARKPELVQAKLEEQRDSLRNTLNLLRNSANENNTLLKNEIREFNALSDKIIKNIKQAMESDSASDADKEAFRKELDTIERLRFLALENESSLVVFKNPSQGIFPLLPSHPDATSRPGGDKSPTTPADAIRFADFVSGNTPDPSSSSFAGILDPATKDIRNARNLDRRTLSSIRGLQKSLESSILETTTELKELDQDVAIGLLIVETLLPAINDGIIKNAKQSNQEEFDKREALIDLLADKIEEKKAKLKAQGCDPSGQSSSLNTPKLGHTLEGPVATFVAQPTPTANDRAIGRLLAPSKKAASYDQSAFQKFNKRFENRPTQSIETASFGPRQITSRNGFTAISDRAFNARFDLRQWRNAQKRLYGQSASLGERADPGAEDGRPLIDLPGFFGDNRFNLFGASSVTIGQNNSAAADQDSLSFAVSGGLSWLLLPKLNVGLAGRYSDGDIDSISSNIDTSTWGIAAFAQTQITTKIAPINLEGIIAYSRSDIDSLFNNAGVITTANDVNTTAFSSQVKASTSFTIDQLTFSPFASLSYIATDRDAFSLSDGQFQNGVNGDQLTFSAGSSLSTAFFLPNTEIRISPSLGLGVFGTVTGGGNVGLSANGGLGIRSKRGISGGLGVGFSGLTGGINNLSFSGNFSIPFN